jgi:hypothetical protein|tara:strand:+ start:3905 stop:4522 length:618 start_codon:yes stop_codon:yes gene_type:complete
MAVNRNFVVKNGLTVNTSLLFVDSATNRIGIGSTVPSTVLDVIGGIAATDLKLSGVSTISGAIYGDGGVAAVQIGSGISIAGITTLAGSGGITTTGGDFYVGGDLYVGDDVEFDSISGRELYVSGIGTVNQFQALTANVSGVSTLSSAIITGVGTVQELNVGTGGTVLYAAQDGTIRLGTATTLATVTLNGGSIPSVGLVIALGG